MIRKPCVRALYIRAMRQWLLPTLAGCLLLVGCGQPDQGTTNPQETLVSTTATAMAMIADAGLNTRVPRPEDLTAIALKEADLQAEQNMLATSAALPTAPPDRQPLPTYLVQPTPTLRVGMADSLHCASDGYSKIDGVVFGVGNCWITINNGVWMRVNAGGDIGDLASHRGGVVVYTSTLDFEHPFTSPIYWTPIDAGIVHIVQVDGSRLILQAENGTQFVFNLTTRAWEDPSTLPTITPENPLTSSLAQAGATADALKQAELDRIERDVATARAQPSPAIREILPTSTPYIASSIDLGIYNNCIGGYRTEFAPRNCWLGVVQGNYMGAISGASIPDPSQGLVAVYTTTADLVGESPLTFYKTPIKVGSVYIKADLNPRFVLEAHDGTIFVFNIVTRAWEDPSTLPTALPTSTAVPTALPTSTPLPTAAPV